MLGFVIGGSNTSSSSNEYEAITEYEAFGMPNAFKWHDGTSADYACSTKDLQTTNTALPENFYKQAFTLDPKTKLADNESIKAVVEDNASSLNLRSLGVDGGGFAGATTATAYSPIIEMGGYAILSDHHPSLATNDYLRLYDVSNGGMVLKDTLDTTNTNNSFGMQATKLTDTLGVCAFYQSNTTTAPFYVRSFKRNGEELENFGAVLSGMTLDWKHGTITRINDEKFLIIGVNASNQLLARVGTVDLSTGTITMDTQFTIYWGGAGFITVERISDENFVVMGGTNKLKVINIDPSTFAITSGATLTASTTNNRGIRKYADNKFLIINNGADGNCFSVSGTTITEGTAYTSAGGVISHSFSGLNAMVQIGDAFYTFHSSAYVVKITISGDTPTGEVLPSQTYLTNYYYPYLINNTLVLRTNTATTTLSTSILDDFTAEIRDGKADELIGTKTVVVKKPWEYSTTGGNIAYLNVSKTLSGSKKGTGYIEIKNISGGEREIRLKNIFCYRK